MKKIMIEIPKELATFLTEEAKNKNRQLGPHCSYIVTAYGRKKTKNTRKGELHEKKKEKNNNL